MIAELEEYIEFCVREMFKAVIPTGHHENLSAVDNPVAQAISKRYGFDAEKASRIYSPIFWCMTLPTYDKSFKDPDGNPGYKLKYPTPIPHNGDSGWMLNPEYKDVTEEKISALAGIIKKEHGSYILGLMKMFNE